jgi:hypothetical protein
MGWSNGSELAAEIWSAVREYIPEGNTRALVARNLIDAFESYDCDTIDEATILCQDARKKLWSSFTGTCDEFDALPEYENLEDTDGKSVG